MSNKKALLVLLCVSLFVHILLSYILQLPENYQNSALRLPDAMSYRQAAKYLYEYGFSAHHIRTFGYPLIVGLPYLLGISADTAIVNFAVALNFLFWLSSVWLVYVIAKSFIGAKGALIIGIAFVLCITHILGSYLVMTETFFLTIMLLASWNLLQFIHFKRDRNIFLFISLLSFSAVVRPVTYYLVILASLFCIVYFIRTKKFRNILIPIIAYCFTIGLQQANMHRKYDVYTLSFIQNYTIYHYLVMPAEYHLFRDKYSPDSFYVGRNEKIKMLIDGLKQEPEKVKKADEYYKSELKRGLVSNRDNIISVFYQNLRHNCNVGNPDIDHLVNHRKSNLFEPVRSFLSGFIRRQDKVLNLLCIISIAVTGMLFLFKKEFRKQKNSVFVVFLNILSSYILITSGVSAWQGDRFVFILQPLTLISGAVLFRYFFPDFKFFSRRSSV